MKDIKIDMVNNTVTMTRRFAERAADPRSEEYRILQDVRTNYPHIQVKRHKIKINPNKESYKGLTYEYMREYILTHEEGKVRDDVIAELDELIYISKCHSDCLRYPTIKAWFLNKYEAVAKFGVNEDIEPKKAYIVDKKGQRHELKDAA